MVAARARAEVHTRSLAQESLADTLLEHTARGERARIAHELHDIVAHHISMVAVQAETARLAVPGMPDAGAQRLSAIGDTARTALSEMRRLLGVLRDDVDTESIPALTPQPGLAQLNELLDTARDASNTATRLILRGPRITVDPTVELVAYRITQEALTNARRHAPGAAVDVELRYGGQALQLRIRDNGPGPAPKRLLRRHGPGRHARARQRSRADNYRPGQRRRRVPRRGHPPGRNARTTVSPATIRILIADDHQVVRTGFRELLDTQPDFSVVGTASDGAEAVRLSRELQADVVLMDVRMPGMDGIAATRELTRSHPDPPRVLILTTFDLDQYVYDALRAGASGFLLKDATAERLFDAVRVIAAGDALLAPAVTRRLITNSPSGPAKQSTPSR